MKRPVTGRISKADAASLKTKGIQAFLCGPKWFLELFAFKSEYQWCVGIRLSALETNMFEIEMLNKTLVHTETEKVFFIMSQKLCIGFFDKEPLELRQRILNTHRIVYLMY